MYILQTSNTVAIAQNLLAQNLAVQEKIRKEVDGIDRSGSFTLEDVNPYHTSKHLQRNFYGTVTLYMILHSSYNDMLKQHTSKNDDEAFQV